MLYDAHGRRLRRIIGFVPEYVEVRDEPKPEVELVDVIAAKDEVDLEEPYHAAEEC
jgi:hypothetical protein